MGAPIVALAGVLLAIAAYPGFSQRTQYLSELGGPHARVPLVFNLSVVAAGLGAFGGGAGFGLAIFALGGRRAAAILTTVCFAIAAFGLVWSGLHPWPDVRHRWVNLGLFIQLAPLFMAWGLWGVEGTRRLSAFLYAVTAAMAVLTVLTKHLLWPGLVHDGNVGWWERGYAFILVGWSAVAAVCLERRLLKASAGSHPPQPAP